MNHVHHQGKFFKSFKDAMLENNYPWIKLQIVDLARFSMTAYTAFSFSKKLEAVQ